MNPFKSDHRIFSAKHRLMSRESALQLFSAVFLFFSIALSAYIYFGCNSLTEDLPSAENMLWSLLGGSLVISFGLSVWMITARQGWIEMERNSRRDPLTGIMNFPAFELMLEEELRRAGRYRYPLTLCLIDLDDFSSLNEQFGRRHGDEILRRFATYLSGNIRFADCVSRYKNDEFWVLLPHTDIVRAEKFMTRLLSNTQEKVDTAFSAGVTSFQAGENKKQFLGRAETALSQAKHEGRKKVRYLVSDSRTVLSF